jgi:hypothetical protein
MRNVSDKISRENQNTCSKTFLRKSCRLRDNVEKYCTAGQTTDDNIIGCMLFVSWIIKATDRHIENAINIAFPQRQWLSEGP